ncbi:MAG: aminoacyltransferase [Clostridiales bacterium]|nr:aminoacyltransferase [Clostridiales bacterium]
MEFTSQVSEAEYTVFVKNHPKSHFLQSYEWGQAARYRGWIPYYTAVTEKGRIIAAALLLKKELPLGYSYFYIPRGYVLDYENTELLAFFTREIDRFTGGRRSIFFLIDPDIKLHEIDREATTLEGENNYPLVAALENIGFKRRPLTYYFETYQPRYTFRIDLSPELSVIRKNYDKSTDQCRKYLDRYSGEIYEGGAEDIEHFNVLMRMTEKRQNFYNGDYGYYRRFYEIFSKSGLVSLILVRLNFAKTVAGLDRKLADLQKSKSIDPDRQQKLLTERHFFEERAKEAEGAVISACMNVTYGDKSWYLYAGNDKTYKMVCASHRLVDYQIENAKRRGLRFFDLFGTIGNRVGSDKKHAKSYSRIYGLHEFKKKFGGEYIEFIGEFYYIQRPVLYKAYRWIAHFRHIISKVLLKVRGGLV